MLALRFEIELVVRAFDNGTRRNNPDFEVVLGKDSETNTTSTFLSKGCVSRLIRSNGGRANLELLGKSGIPMQSDGIGVAA